MIDLNVIWSEPYKIKTKYGEQFRREWLIPPDVRATFFDYWRGNSFKLKDKGFGVQKVDSDWFLIETKLALHHFKEYQHTAPAIEESDFILLPKDVKDVSGLRTWQVNSVGKLCAALEKWNCAIDGSDLGIGKTYIACAVARELDMDILVVCPKAVTETWRRVVCNHFSMKSRLRGIINYEMLRRGKKNSDIASFVKNRTTHKEEFTWKIPKNTLIVWDESQKLKGAATQNSKTCLHALKQGYKMLFCSATNATNPLELRTVGMCIQLFKNGKQYYQWLYAHGVDRGRFGLEFNNSKDVLRKLHKDIFHDRGVRLTRDTIPNFPESEIIAECYNMEDESTKKINQHYEEMEKELAKIRKKEKTDKTSELTAILRARQKIELVKVPLFIDMIEEGIENDMSVVVFVNFTDTLTGLAERLNTSCIFDGKTKDEIRQKNVDNFQEDKERIILVNIQSGGAGLTLGDMTGKYPRLALISPSYSAIHMRQSTGRIWRESSKTKSIQKIIFVAGTVEEQVCDNVNKKLLNLDLLNDGDLLYDQKSNDKKEANKEDSK
jgi:hypothetical protein